MRVSVDRRRHLAGLAAALVLLLPTLAYGEVVYAEQVETYDVGTRGGTPNDLWKSIGRFGPKLDGSDAIGTTGGSVAWGPYKATRTPQGCVIKDLKVDVSVKILLPEWQLSYTGTPASQAFWDCVVRTVTIHENRHAEIWRETGDRIDRALLGLGPIPCNDVKSRVDQVARAIHGEGRERQAAFDAEDKRKRRYEQCFALRNRPTAAGQPAGQEAPRAAARAVAGAAGQRQAQAPAIEGSDGLLDGFGSAILKFTLLAAALTAGYLGSMRLALRFAAKRASEEEDGVPPLPPFPARAIRSAETAGGFARGAPRPAAAFGQSRASFGLRKA